MGLLKNLTGTCRPGAGRLLSSFSAIPSTIATYRRKTLGTALAIVTDVPVSRFGPRRLAMHTAILEWLYIMWAMQVKDLIFATKLTPDLAILGIVYRRKTFTFTTITQPPVCSR